MVNIPLVVLNNGQKCPIIGLGTWLAKSDEVADAVKHAIDVGYRHFDCAHVYRNEKEIGVGLTAKLAERVVKREDLFITSKLWSTSHHPDLVEGGMKTTLKNLGLDYLDLYLIHWPQGFKEGDELFPVDDDGKMIPSGVDYIDTWKVMEDLVDKGLTKSIGLSNFNKRQIERVLKVARIKPAVLQIEVHPYLNQVKLLELCGCLNIAVTAHATLGSPERPWAKPSDPLLLEDPRLKPIADRYSKTVAQVLIRYALDRGMITVPKSSSRSHIEENLVVFDFKLSSKDIDLIAAMECNVRFCSIWDVHHPDYPFHDEY